MFEDSKLKEVAQRQEEWENTTLNELIQRHPERRREFLNESGIPLKRIYTPNDVAGIDYVKELDFPGSFPYTRGAYATMYRGRVWSHRQIIGFGGPDEGNARLSQFVEQGMTALSLGPDMNITFGYDPDDPEVRDILGRIGSIMPSLVEWEMYLDGLPLDKLTVSVNETACGIVSLCMYMAVAEKMGIPKEKLNGTLQHDVLCMLHAEPFPWLPLEGAMRVAMDIFKYTCEYMPKWNPVLINGYNVRESGVTPLQELAFMMADAICYTEEALKVGLTVDQIAPKYAFYFGIGSSFFEEIAKVRAARKMWARIAKDRFGAKNPESLKMRYHVQTCGSTLTSQQPFNNIVRCTVQALSAILGGCNSLHVNSMDEAYASPTEQAALTALRTQLILEHETGIADVIDPLGGSYYIEALTEQMIKGAQEYLDRIDAMGGVLAGVRNGYFMREIARSAHKYQAEIERGERAIVGVNIYQTDEEIPIEIYRPDQKVIDEAIDRVVRLRRTRNHNRWNKSLEAVRAACRSGENLVPVVLEACKSYATYAEIARVLKEEFGEVQYPAIF